MKPIKLGTIAKGAELLHQEGAREVYACCTHAVFRYAIFVPTMVFPVDIDVVS
jgi:phosphoribosylpyrophosphate synthetase